jgi:hypothetical protein
MYFQVDLFTHSDKEKFIVSQKRQNTKTEKPFSLQGCTILANIPDDLLASYYLFYQQQKKQIESEKGCQLNEV